MRKMISAKKQTDEVRFKISAEDAKLILLIAERAVVVADRSASSLTLNALDMAMDLTAAHLNGTPLDLDGLAEAPHSELMHDVLGICKHLDWHTGRLDQSFVPLFEGVQPAGDLVN